MQDPGILIVIVVYNTSFESSKTFLSMTESVKKFAQKLDLVVYDNNPAGKMPVADGYGFWNITYIPDRNNSGVSKAYNVAAGIAADRSKTWLMLLDEDTDFPVDTIRTYVTAIGAHPHEELFAPIMLTSDRKIISPGFFRLMRGFYANQADPGPGSLKGKSLINCGLCIKLDTFKKLGGYNELIKLDFSDHEFIRRFKEQVTDGFFLVNLQVVHGLSTSTRNSYNSDIKRFQYYLEGARYFSRSLAESLMINFHVFLRALKLSVLHKNRAFLAKALKSIFK